MCNKFHHDFKTCFLICVLSGAQLWTWFRSMRTVYGKLRKQTLKSGAAAKKLTARQQWTLASFSFLHSHAVVRTETRQLGCLPAPARGAHAALDSGSKVDDDEAQDSQDAQVVINPVINLDPTQPQVGSQPAPPRTTTRGKKLPPRPLMQPS